VQPAAKRSDDREALDPRREGGLEAWTIRWMGEAGPNFNDGGLGAKRISFAEFTLHPERPRRTGKQCGGEPRGP